jgi:hypothetical protein
MRVWPIIIGIAIIFTLVCSPALAISKSDLISYYKGQSPPAVPIPTPTVIPFKPTPTSTPTPNNTSDELPPSSLWVNSTPGGAMVFIDGSYKGPTPINIWDLSVGTHQLRVFRAGYEDYSSEIMISKCYLAPWMGHEVIGCNMTAVDITLKKVEATLCGSCDIPPGYAWIGGRLLLLPTTNPTLKTGEDLPGLYLQFL